MKRKTYNKKFVCGRNQTNWDGPDSLYYSTYNFDGLLTFCVKTHNSHCIWGGNYIIMKNSWARAFGDVEGVAAEDDAAWDPRSGITWDRSLARMRWTHFSQLARAWREIFLYIVFGSWVKTQFYKNSFSCAAACDWWMKIFKDIRRMHFPWNCFHVNYV